MKKSTKAVLLSALVFPGSGHFFLKKYIHGAVLSVVSLAGIYYLVSKTVEKVLQISEKIQSGTVQPNVSQISELIAAQSTGPEADLINIVTIVLVICWVFGIVDAYRSGRRQENK